MQVSVGHLNFAVLDFPDGRALYIDWRMERVDDRRRLILALHDIYRPFSERQGITGQGRRDWRIGPLRVAWYGKGVE